MYLENRERIIGAILLIAGCCIGAGMLGLPLVTATAGFLPTLLIFFLSWAFMAATGLLLLEANLWFAQGTNLMTLSEYTLGKGAKYAVALLFIFLFYCLMVAYLAGGGALISEFIEQISGVTLPAYVGSLGLVFVLGLVIFLGTREVDLVNRMLMLGLGMSYVALIFLGLPHVDSQNLKHSHWVFALPAFPAMIISFGFHNLVPSLTDYLDKNVKALRFSILVGSAIPLFVYLLWEGMILGILPPGNEVKEAIDSGAMVTTLLRNAVGSSYVVDLMQAFAFFALVTSFIAVALSFVDFLSDGLHVKKTSQGSLLLLSLVMLPPLLFAYLYPTIFLMALTYAGAFGAVVLFGIIPVLMVWKGRYYEGRQGAHMLPGGKLTLILVGVFACFVFLLQLKNELGL